MESCEEGRMNPVEHNLEDDDGVIRDERLVRLLEPPFTSDALHFKIALRGLLVLRATIKRSDNIECMMTFHFVFPVSFCFLYTPTVYHM